MAAWAVRGATPLIGLLPGIMTSSVLLQQAAACDAAQQEQRDVLKAAALGCRKVPEQLPPADSGGRPALYRQGPSDVIEDPCVGDPQPFGFLLGERRLARQLLLDDLQAPRWWCGQRPPCRPRGGGGAGPRSGCHNGKSAPGSLAARPAAVIMAWASWPHRRAPGTAHAVGTRATAAPARRVLATSAGGGKHHGLPGHHARELL